MTFYNQHSTALVGAAGQPQGHFLEDSLRLRSSASAYLNRTPTSTGNRKTWTWSGWVKRSKLNAFNPLFQANHSGVPWFVLGFANNDKIEVTQTAGSSASWESTAVFRDVSAWYHVVLVVDTTSATSTMAGSSTDRFRLYVNGVQYVITGGTVPTQNSDLQVNNTVAHTIGGYSTNMTDGYLTEVNFIDGQALDPSYFGETDTVTGVWKPIEYTGSYGTNGFYLPMTPTSQAEGFNTVLYKGTGATQSITGVGFSPDFVWIKTRSNVASHSIFDSIRGVNNWLASDSPDAAFGGQTDLLTSFGSDGFSLGANTGSKTVNKSGQNFVAWCWDAGSGSPASNTDGSITSTVKANQAKGFSIVTYTGNSTVGATVGHGLGVDPKLIIIKSRSNAYNWVVGSKAVDGFSSGKQLYLNTTAAQVGAENFFANTQPTSTVFSIKDNFEVNYSGHTYVAYCFAEISGYSKIGSYTGTGASGNSITTGFKPAWLLIKRTDSADKWTIRDGVRSPFNPIKLTLNPNDSGAEYTPASEDYDFDSNGFTLNNSNGAFNASGGTYMYMAIADTRNTAFNNDASGNKNNWTPNNINSNASGQSTYDLMTDVPTLTSETAANYATLNTVVPTNAGAVSDGNLTWTLTGSFGTKEVSIQSSTLLQYAEFYVTSGLPSFGVKTPGVNLNTNIGTVPAGYWGIYDNGSGFYLIANGSATYSTSTTVAAGQTWQVAYNPITGKAWIGKNNVWYNSSGGTNGDPATDANPTFSSLGNGLVMFVSGGNVSAVANANFGQRPFSYTPPTGFKALNTYNLPDPTIKDGSDYFNTVLYTGNASSSRDITGVGFQPDFVWFKERSVARFHRLFDVIRGTGKKLYTNDTSAELTTTTELNGFLSDGFNIGSDAGVNQNGETYVAWNWKANGSGVSNTDGSITSTVSANTTSGFSIVTYTGDGSNANRTVGHGLGVAPEMVIVKTRSEAARNWLIWHKDLTNYDYALLFTTDAQAANRFGPSAPTSSVFGVYGGQGNRGTETFVSYCFAPIAGYSAFGKYTGNGSTDGPFVYTGFRPAFIIFKRSDAAASWRIMDTSRSPINATQIEIYPNLSNAEAGAANGMDIVSNGFKLRGSYAEWNGSGGTYIYMAFAENPFKYSLAR